MKVKDLMTHNSVSCDMATNLEEVTLRMWNGDFGVMPVTDNFNKVIGIITDRDIAMASALQHKSPAEILVGDVIKEHPVFICHPEDEVKTVLEEMAVDKVRRLPVVNDEGQIIGMLSLSDIAAYAGNKKASSATAAELVNAFKAIAAPHMEHQKMVSAG
ncbi:MAG TPA: CBS domain-containing protein [Alphaproteobacteria bacterium]|nr:CBS domain-containing protein [Alphaproteobacteria bacterium]